MQDTKCQPDPKPDAPLLPTHRDRVRQHIQAQDLSAGDRKPTNIRKGSSDCSRRLCVLIMISCYCNSFSFSFRLPVGCLSPFTSGYQHISTTLVKQLMCANKHKFDSQLCIVERLLEAAAKIPPGSSATRYITYRKLGFSKSVASAPSNVSSSTPPAATTA